MRQSHRSSVPLRSSPIRCGAATDKTENADPNKYFAMGGSLFARVKEHS